MPASTRPPSTTPSSPRKRHEPSVTVHGHAPVTHGHEEPAVTHPLLRRGGVRERSRKAHAEGVTTRTKESPNVKALETHYRGWRFRSRIEARWAVFFDALGISWDYELEPWKRHRSGRTSSPSWKAGPDGPARPAASSTGSPTRPATGPRRASTGRGTRGRFPVRSGGSPRRSGRSTGKSRSAGSLAGTGPGWSPSRRSPPMPDAIQGGDFCVPTVPCVPARDGGTQRDANCGTLNSDRLLW